MILQRDQKINLWGWAAPHEKINIRFNGKVYKTQADADGKWITQLPPTKAGGPYTIDINKITLHEILFGDVWLCSGQSNMVHQMNIHDVRYAREIAEANDPQIRQFWVSSSTGYWKAAVGEDVRPFSAVAYFFAKKLYQQYKIPVGIINASVGGTPIEAWISEQGLKQFPSPNSSAVPTISTHASPTDAGLVAKWYNPDYIPKGWHNINIPGYWEDQGVKNLNGIVWYRREIDIPATMAGKPAKVFLGRIVDADELYINGKLIGSITYQYPQRRYNVPSDLLKAGKNIFVIRVTNNTGKGGFVPDKPYFIFTNTDTIDLKGYWTYKVGATFSPSANNDFPTPSASLYNAMIAPSINYTIKGFCWYQGESNTSRPTQYKKLLPALINDWRTKWNQGLLPFLYVQLPGFMDYNYSPEESNWALLRESQLTSLSVPNTAMAVAIDLGEWNDVHPDNKKDVGERLALAAMKVAYKENITYSGPLYTSSIIEGNKITISFTNTGKGLTTADGEPPSTFAIAGADKKFVWANTKIEGNKIIAWSDEIPEPKYVRYAWADNPVNPNLFNIDGLPASPFRTDD
jgi:sialate O-acetylesterase